MRRFCLLIVALFCLALPAGAQFYISGDDPASQKWSQISTLNYRIIYPRGLDSLAREYGRALEWNRDPVGTSIFMLPNQQYRRPMPVILRTNTAIANGSVAWAPRRMELYTVMDPYGGEPFPWIQSLAIHESRHVAQMQYGRYRKFNFLHYLSGELFAGAFAGLYGGPWLLEGDAVVAETGLSQFGRGRSADFLDYYRVCLSDGDWRDWFRWRWGSIKHYTPDYYRLGYMTVAGMRTTFGDPMFTARFYDRIYRKAFPPFPFNVFRKTVKQDTGMGIKKSFRRIEEDFLKDWQEQEALREPFMPSERVTARPRRYESIRGTAVTDDGMVALRSGLTRSPELVSVTDDGRMKRLAYFGSYTSMPIWNPVNGQLYWTETIPDRRWGMRSESALVAWGPEGRKTIAPGHRYFNPSVDEKGRVLVSEYLQNGTTRLVSLDGASGERLDSIKAPGGMQIVESASIGGRIFVSAITDQGNGIFEAGAGFRTLVPAGPVKIQQLRVHDGQLMFISDRDGSNELYSVDIDGNVRQWTSARFGITDFALRGDTLYYSALTRDARGMYRTALGDLPVRSVDFADVYKHPVSEELSRQEREMFTDRRHETGFTPVQPYNKLLHGLHIHSWAPFYFDYGSVTELSTESEYAIGGLGGTVLFQNHLGTLNGSAGLSVAPAGGKNWSRSAHLSLSYSGQYPVFELEMHYGNDNLRLQYGQLRHISESESYTMMTGRRLEGKDALDGVLQCYVPLNFSSGGWQRGVIPQLRVAFSNSLFNKSEIAAVEAPMIGDGLVVTQFDSYTPGRYAPWSRTVMSVRAYSSLATAPSALQPRWGGGVDAGLALRPGLTDLFSPAAYALAYGYLPGLMRTHGIKLSATGQYIFAGTERFSEAYLSILPRGLESSGAAVYLGQLYPAQAKLSAEYALPFLPLDCSWFGPLAYLKNFELRAFADLALLGGPSGQREALGVTSGGGNLYSVGCSVALRLANFLWLPYDTLIGLSWSRNGGSAIPALRSAGYSIETDYFGAIFSIDL
ncbi:MAG: hypothetical protein IJS07_04900 [Bacteroidales bacterium]|nr:hypothetical protein [Bacteroidales bacterium]